MPRPGRPQSTRRTPRGRRCSRCRSSRSAEALRARGLPPAAARAGDRASVASFFNAGVAALLLGVFYSTARSLGVSACGGAGGCAAARIHDAAVGVREELHGRAARGARTAAGARRRGARTHRRPRRVARSGSGRVARGVGRSSACCRSRCAALFPLARAPRRAWRWRADRGWRSRCWRHAAYDVARFGTPFETGYGAQATPAAYTTPLLVGLYGLLLSSGKGVMWFAPALWLAPAGWRAMRAGAGRARATALGALLMGAVALILYGRFQHWAGDGSLGPRYLVPLLPARASCSVAFALDRAARVAARGGTRARSRRAAGQDRRRRASTSELRCARPGTIPTRWRSNDPHFMREQPFQPALQPDRRPLDDAAAQSREHRAWRACAAHRGRRRRRSAARRSARQEDQRALLHAIRLLVDVRDLRRRARAAAGAGGAGDVRRRRSRRGACARRARRGAKRREDARDRSCSTGTASPTRARCSPTLARLPHARGLVDRACMVVDNGSSDGSAATLAAEFPDVELLRSA